MINVNYWLKAKDGRLCNYRKCLRSAYTHHILRTEVFIDASEPLDTITDGISCFSTVI